jgi:hypothetical protein
MKRSVHLIRVLQRAGLGVLLLVLFPFHASLAQERTATLTGRVVDAKTGVALPDVGVQVVGTTLGAQSAIDGRYTIRNVPAGTLTLHARRIGFTPKTITALMVASGETLEMTSCWSPRRYSSRHRSSPRRRSADR